jgi:hypothetical protein
MVAGVSVNEAYDGLGNAFDLYHNIYQRNSIDNDNWLARRSSAVNEGPRAACHGPRLGNDPQAADMKQYSHGEQRRSALWIGQHRT